MRLLGIDPGTARMGYGVVNFSSKLGPKLIVSDVIITSADLSTEQRLKFLYKTLTQIIKDYEPDVFVIERLFFNTNAKTAMTVGQARGVAMLAAAMKNLPLFEYTALEAKLSVTGYGRSDKKVVQSCVKDILGLDTIIKSDDANDAVAIALCHTIKGLAYVKP